MNKPLIAKKDIVREVVADTKLPKKDVSDVTNDVVAKIEEHLAKGDDVRFFGFGTFYTNHHKARKGHNPQTGKELKIPAHNAAGFHAGAHLKKVIY